ncbi:SDR family oxidoreductase [Amaricoccus macauensis]|uniref:SDR family oxidoreductase n=1 Tax=Amaricoccus macauensis TaxID=57001 RepID=UPI003C7A78CE
MQNVVTGRKVLITGASRGIGEATARHLAGLGADIILAARSAGAIEAIAEDIRADGGKATAKTCNVASYADAEAAVGEGVDVLVNNAGLIDPIARIHESDPEAWARVIDVNVKGVYNCARAALPGMLAKGAGTIINISSGAATGALEGWSHYCASKAAALSLTHCLDKEYRESGIRVIGLSPGTVATEMQTTIKASGINPVSQLDWSAHIPPEAVGRAIAWLCGPGGDAYRGTDFSLRTVEGRRAAELPVEGATA